MSKVLSYNRNQDRWQVRDEDGNTDEPEKFIARCAHCDAEMFRTQSHLYDEAHLQRSPQMGIAHGSLVFTDDLALEYEVPQRNLK